MAQPPCAEHDDERLPEVYLEPLTSPAETTLIGSLAAIAFALPVLRNALPGSPPLGVEADMWVFLWAELAAVLALALLVFK